MFPDIIQEEIRKLIAQGRYYEARERLPELMDSDFSRMCRLRVEIDTAELRSRLACARPPVTVTDSPPAYHLTEG